MKKEFWKDWKKVTEIEKNAIKSLLEGKKIILENIPKEEIVSIYVKGSFIRREMNKHSDVDTVTILKNSKYLKKLQKLKKNYREKFKPKLEFAGYSLWELKTNRRAGAGKKDRAAPSRMLKHLPHYKLIYGKELDTDKYFKGDDLKIISSTTKFFKTRFVPDYENKKLGFSEISKQVFWLVDNEQRALGKNPPHNWKELTKSIKDKNHIIHDTLKLRLHPTKDKKERAKYISKLKKYLNRLEREYDKH